MSGVSGDEIAGRPMQGQRPSPPDRLEGHDMQFGISVLSEEV
jgi:hypothetical protein